MKEYVFHEVVGKMKQRLEEIEMTNVVAIENEFYAYFGFLTSLVELPISLAFPKDIEDSKSNK